MRPKYSIVLPTLNGGATLAVTLPAMLRIDRDDVEWIISENRSNDGSYELLREIVHDDDRVRLVRPAERLPIGKHLEFAYQQARGRWLSHIGDDDYLLPWRFDLLDQVLGELDPACGLIRGEYFRYHWPDYPDSTKANSLDSARFDGILHVQSGLEFATKLLNQPHIHGGGAWVVRSDIVQAVRRRCGFFASPQHVEFFAMRAAATLSEQVASVGLPLFILGRHAKSSGTQYFSRKCEATASDWDWTFEDPDAYRHCPFNWKSYSTLSLDAARMVQEILSAELGDEKIAWHAWTKTIHSEMMRLVRFGQLPSAAMQDFLTAVRNIPGEGNLYWQWRTLRLRLQTQKADRDALREETNGFFLNAESGFELRSSVSGQEHGFDSIVSAARWLEVASTGRLLNLYATQLAK